MRDVRDPDALWIYSSSPLWIDNLRSLTHPSYDLHILRHDSAFGLRRIEFENTRLSRKAEAELLTWLDGQTNVVSLHFPFLDDDDDDASPPMLLPPHLHDTFTHTEATLLPNLTILHASPHLIILFAPSRPLIDASVTISTPIYAGFRPTTTLESLPPSVRCLRFTFNSVGKRTEEKTLHSAIVVCPAIEELEIEGEAGEECWCSIVPHFKYLRVLLMRKPGTAEVKTAKEELDERFPLPKCARTHSTSSTISHSGHSMAVSERAHAVRLANACPALQCVVFPNRVQWHRPSPLPRSQSSPCLPFDDLFVKKINCDVPPPPPPRKVIPLAEQRFMRGEQCFDLNNSDDDDSLFFKPSQSRQSNSIQRYQEQVEVEVHGAGKMVMVLV
ncbi:uncharacterized protein ARMOST_22479 [Armillaria ostoyae]|uniref:Uncharacterized protein n=1 Tax=Armillaria ostoyae TaxID=47428 RepID=A0A284SCY8_ARMOS|nr:uncharacterized protein ARMOST_22479 [Armillaria ostoyae]